MLERPSSRQPIPPEAKCVFKGKTFDVFQWEQQMFDGTIQIFEKIKRADTVNVLPITMDGKIILTRQEQPGLEPYVGTVGGRVDINEKPEEAIRRELLEETGYEAKEIFLWDAVQPLDKVDWAIYTFIAKGCQKVQEQQLESGEKIELFFVSFDQFINITAQDNYRDFEIALKVFKLTQNSQLLENMRRLLI